MSMNDNVLDFTSIEAANAAIDRLTSLKDTIRSDAKSAPEVYGEDDGVYMLFSALEGMLSRFRRFDPETDSMTMPADVITLMTDQLIPSLTATADKLERLYAEAKQAIEAGSDGETVVTPYFEAYEAENGNNELARLQAAYTAVQNVAQGMALDTVLEAFNAAFA